MSTCEKNGVRIEAGQITNPDSFPYANELVCIQVPKVFDQVAIRDCVTRTLTLLPGSGVITPTFTFQAVDGFDIVEIKIVSCSEALKGPGYKKMRMFARMGCTIHYSDGLNDMTQYAEMTHNLTINEIYCPNCTTQIGLIRFPKEPGDRTIDTDGNIIKVEAIAEAFNELLDSVTGLMSMDVGVFFIVKCECIVQLLMPCYGYCPVPPEQVNPGAQTCKTFNDRMKTPFPRTFFPDQKYNPLDG